MKSNLASHLQNKDVYEGSKTVEHYAQASGLQPAEKLLFDKYIKPGSAILDIGIGGGRTTEDLKAREGSYIGIDYSSGMIAAAKPKFPGLDLRVMDASNLSDFKSSSFDVVIFSFNGLDNLHPESKRTLCIRECHRVLKPGGIFIFSCHNPRWLGIIPILSGVSALRAVWRIVYAMARCLQLTLIQPTRAPFWTSRGYYNDPVHGGLVTFAVTPSEVHVEMMANGFKLQDSIGGSAFPFAPKMFQPWNYFAAKRLDS